MDKVIKEQCHTEEQSCEVSEQHDQVVKSDFRFRGEVAEAILTGTKAQQCDIISEQNRPQDQSKLMSMQELLSKNPEKDVATVVNSNVSIASQKFSHHVSSNLSELLENNITVWEKTQKLLEINIEVLGKTQKLLEDNIKVHEKTHKLLEDNIKVQEKLYQLLKEFKDTNRNPIIVERPMPIIGSCGEREYIDCDIPAKQRHQPEISAQTKALESQLNEMSASIEPPTETTQLFSKQLWNLCQQQVHKNKSVETLPEQPQPEEIGYSEQLWELPTMEGENEELSGPVRKKMRSSSEAIYVTLVQVHNTAVTSDFQDKQPSESDCEVAQAPKCQDEDHQAEHVIKVKAVQSSTLSLELVASGQSCQRQLWEQEQQPQRQLRLQGRKSVKSDGGVAMAPECQEEQPKDSIQERMKLDHKPAKQGQFCPGGQRCSISGLSQATFMVELKNQDTGGQIVETTPELKTSAEEICQTQLQERQLRPRSNNLFESKHSSLSNTGMPRVEKPGVEDTSQQKK